MRKRKHFSTYLLISALIFSSLIPARASAQSDNGLRRNINPNSGKINFINSENGRAIPVSKASGMFPNPDEFAKSIAIRFAPEFGLQASSKSFSETRKSQTSSDHIITRFQQQHNGVPVFGGEIIVNTNQHGDLFSISGEVSPNPPVQTQPTIDSTQAANFALLAVSKWYEMDTANFHATDPELWIYDESLLKPSNRPVELVWRLEISANDESLPIRELILVNADTGNISLHFNQVDTFWSISNNHKASQDSANVEKINAVLGSPQVSTYTANNGTLLPGSFLCNQNQPNCTNGSDSHADAAHKYALGTYNIYAANHSRDSIDNAGMVIKSTVHYSSNYSNAFWNGSQMVYGDGLGFPLADDVVAHELTHGVTQYESELFYYYQSGAINESFSDVWGEYYDQANGLGTDTANVKWLLGEDISGYGAIRSMNNPPAYGDPDKMSSTNYYLSTGDNGGVHTNSGLNNKAVSLMVDGGSFNGKTVTALGWTKVEQIYYDVQANLLVSGSDYSDLYYALQQACSDLIGQYDITSDDCVEVKDAIDAVEMNSQPTAGFNTDAPYCDSPNAIITDIFSDDLETGSLNWTFTNGTYTRWQYEDPPFGKYTHSGLHALYANDEPAITTDAYAKLTSIAIPTGAYLHFAHAYDFEISIGKYWDGGVIEYSTNGSTWIDAGSLMEYNGYDNTIWQTANNPLANRSAFVGVSNGYISTRLNLSSLAGQTVAFRWRMGLDESVSSGGWFVDDARIYQCVNISGPPFVTSIIHSSTNWGSTISVNFTVNFSETVTGVDVNDFTVDINGTTNPFIQNVTGSGNTYTVTVQTTGGAGTIRLDLLDNDSITDNDGNPLGGIGVGNGDFYSGETYEFFGPQIFISIPSQDGWTLESSETSGKGGTKNNKATTIRIGDNVAKKQYRGILSFNTSSLPDDAVITNVTLKVKKAGIMGGGNPINIFNGFMVDVNRGNFGKAYLSPSDFQIKTIRTKTLGAFKPGLNSGWYTINLTNGKAYINKTGNTQIRLRFKLDDNNNLIANFLKLYSGNAVSASRPKLTIEYYVP